MESSSSQSSSLGRTRLFVALWVAVAIQILGRLLDLRWHLSHDEFEGAADQVQAHWLLWLGTVMVVVASTLALRIVITNLERRWLQLTIWANLFYAVLSVVHFIQHSNRSEVDWTHLALAIASIAATAGVLLVTADFVRGNRRSPKDLRAS